MRDRPHFPEITHGQVHPGDRNGLRKTQRVTTFKGDDRPSITVLAPGGIEHAGLSILASRWAEALASNGCTCRLMLGVAERHPDEGEAVEFDSMQEAISEWAECPDPDKRLLAVGLPPSVEEARAAIGALAAAGSRAVLLWEQPHTPVLGLAARLKVTPPPGVRVGTLNPRFVAPLRKQLGESDVVTLPLALPHLDVPMDPPEPSPTPYAISIGRYTSRKGAARLCSVWADGIGEELGTELLMLGSGYDGLDSDRDAVLGLAKRSPWIRCESIGTFRKRLARIRGARCAIFAATDDHLPQALIEVLIARVPAVVTPIDPHLALIRHGVTGFVLPDVELTDLQGALERHILDSPDGCREVTQAGAALVAETFSPQIAGRVILSHLL